MEVFCDNQVINQVMRSEIIRIITKVDCCNQVENQVGVGGLCRLISLKLMVAIKLEIKLLLIRLFAYH